MRAEIDRLRQILWDIARMTGYEGPDEAPATGRLDPDVPEIAMDSVKAHCADYLTYTGPQGRDVNPDAGPDDRCTCGQTITWLNDTWVHLYNERLLRRLHTPAPASGYYSPDHPEPPEQSLEPSEQPEYTYALGGIPLSMTSTPADASAIRAVAERLRQITPTPSWRTTSTNTEFWTEQPQPLRRSDRDEEAIQDDEEGPF